MSITTQINRIKDEVAHQSDLLNQVNEQIEGKENHIESLNCMMDGTGIKVYNPSIRQVRSYAFYNHPTIQEVDIPNAYEIKDYAFMGAEQLNKINAPNVVQIGGAPWSTNSVQKEIYAPNLQSIKSNTFANCSYKDLNFPILTTIPAGAFQVVIADSLTLPNIENLSSHCLGSASINILSIPKVTQLKNLYSITDAYIEELNLPELEEIESDLYSINGLTSLYLPKLKTLKYGLYQCTNLVDINCPELTTVYGGLWGCGFSTISDSNFPKLERIEGNAMPWGDALTTINSSSLLEINAESASPCFRGDGLTTVTLPNLQYMGIYSFYGCQYLTDIYLLGELMAGLEQDAIYDCPNVSIWVPNELYNDYMDNATGEIGQYIWPISTPTIKNQYKNVAGLAGQTFSVTVPWRNITNASVSITCENCSYSNMKTSDKGVTFDITLGTSGDGHCDCSITGDVTSLSVFNTHVMADSDYRYTVTNRSSTYGFSLNSSGYYESNNKGVNSSYAVCRVYLYNDYDSNGKLPSTIYIDCINSGESGCDYGIIGKRGYSLSLSTSVDSSSSYIKKFTTSSTSVQTVTYSNFGTSGGYFDIKYRKDGSVNNGNDSLQFKIRFS